MASTYSDLKIQLLTTGENNTTWGNVTNVNLGTAIEEAITGSADVTFASADVTLTLTNTNTTQTARNLRLNLTGTTGGARNLIVPAINKVYIVNNGCADAVTVQNSTGTGIAVPAGKTMWVYNDGTNVVDATTYLTSLTLGAALPVTSGGTGVTTSTGSGNVVLSASPTLTGTLTAAAGTFSDLITAAAGVSSTLTTDATSSTTGSIITAGGISAQKALYVGTTANIAGAITATGGITVSGGAAATNTWTGASGSSLPVTALAAATGANRYLVTVTFKGVLSNPNGTPITPSITITLKDGAGGSTIGTPSTYTKTVATSYSGVFVVSLSQMVSQPANNGVEAAITDTEGDGGSHSWSDIDVQISVCNMQLG
jgi:hypothetical protein